MKTALVTGAYKGLGLEWCRQLGKLGYTVILTAREIEKAKVAADTLSKEGLTVIPKPLEVTNESEMTSLAHWIEFNYGHLDVLVNNAGINSATRAKGDKHVMEKNLTLTSLDPNEVLNMIHINAISPVLMAKHFKQVLAKANGAKIINIGSWLGSISEKNTGGNYSYSVSKSALSMMNKILSYDLEHDKITTVVVNPGWVQTDMGGARAGLTPEQSVKSVIEHVLDKITLKDSGLFFNHDGKHHPW